MIYDKTKHILHRELVELMGIASMALNGILRESDAALKRLGRVDKSKAVRGSFYDRTQALAWAEDWKKNDVLEEKPVAAAPPKAPRAHSGSGIKAGPRTPAAFRELTLSRGLAQNFERASRYQRPLYTPNGYGHYAVSWGGKEGE